jgi:hypothetical protein
MFVSFGLHRYRKKAIRNLRKKKEFIFLSLCGGFFYRWALVGFGIYKKLFPDQMHPGGNKKGWILLAPFVFVF